MMKTLLARHWGKITLLVILTGFIVAAPFLFTSNHSHDASTGYHCPMHPSYTSDTPGDCPICGMRLVPIGGVADGGVEDLYVCPMHPEVQQHEPGRCPKCGMDLVKQAGGDPDAAAAGDLYVCPMHPEVQQHEPGRCPKCGMDLVKQAGGDPDAAAAGDLYVCPMHPEVQQHEPGRCPKCGMDLVKQPRQEAAPTASRAVEGLAPFRLSRQQSALAGVRTIEAVSGELSTTIRAVGNVVEDETRVRQVTTKVSGWVEHLYANAIGQVVKAGEPLIDLFSPELLASQEEYLRARQTSAEFERSSLPEVRRGGLDLAAAARRRLELFDVPPAFIDEIEQTGRASRTITLRAPFNGHVTQKTVVEGQRIDAGMPLMTVVDLSRVWVVAQLYETEAGSARIGQPAAVSLQHDPAVKLSGRVSLVYPTVDVASRTIQVRFEFANPRLVLKPGMFVNVEIDRGRARGVLIPDSALIDTGTRQVVFVETSPGRFDPREVRAGLRSDGHLLVESGLKAGERVAVSANFLLDSESRLRALIQR